jgi:PAS domain S-box-containing protein
MSSDLMSIRGGVPNEGTDALASYKVEEAFRLMAEAVEDCAVFILDANGRVASWNRGAERIKGYQAAEIVGRHFSVFYPPEAIASGWPDLAIEMATREGRHRDEGWRIRKDGTRFWAYVVTTALRTNDGMLVGFGKVTRDLTEKRSAERPFRLMVEAVEDYALLMLDPQGYVTTWNAGAERIKGYQAEEIIGKHFSVFYPRKSIAAGVPAFELAEATENGRYEDEGWRVRKNGSQFWANVVITPVRDDNGMLIGFGKVTRDLTEKRLAEQELASVYAQVNSVLECTSDSVMKINLQWVLVYGNRKAIENLPDFKLGKSYWACFPGAIGTPLEETLRTAMEKRTAATYEVFYAPYEQWHRGHVYPSEDGLSVFFANVTEEKALQEKVEREQFLKEKRIEALSHMAGGLAHEINNPLAIIHGRASDLLHLASGDAPPSTEAVRKACESIVKTSDRAMRILRGLKGFGREASKDPMETASIYEIVDQCVEIQESRFERHKVELRLDLKPQLPYIECRETQIGQILTNLLNNAFDAIVQGDAQERWVSMAASLVDNHLQVDVTDSGPGVEDKFKAHLMEPFFTTKEIGLGMGVGLSLSRAIAQEHGGTLMLCEGSEHTCFRLLLPLQPDSEN